MEDVRNTVRTPTALVDNGEISLAEMLATALRHKKTITWFTLFFAVISIGVSFALPNIYKASTTLLPPQQSQSSAAGLLSQLGGVAGLAAGMSSIKNPNDLYVGMLKSRTIADKLISKFRLKEAYDVDLQEKARRELADHTTITNGKDGFIVIEFEGADPKSVANIANAYVEELLGLSKVLAVTESAQRRVFYENQLNLAKDNLVKAEAKLKGSIDTRGVISVDSESRTVLETVARVRAQISMKEVQLSSMGAFLTSSHPEYKRIVEELNGLRAELTRLENGSDGNNENTAPTTNNQRGLGNIQLLRDVKYYQMLYELLAKQYEVARLDEAKDPAIIQVLDRAEMPERKFKPRRLLIVLLSTFAAFFAVTCWVLGLEIRRKAATSFHRVT